MNFAQFTLAGRGHLPAPLPARLPVRIPVRVAAPASVLTSIPGRTPIRVSAPVLGAARTLVAILALLSVPALSFGPAPALAHGVYIFAWAEADQVCSESYFSKKSKVRGGEVEVYGADGSLLASGRSDEAGRICFPGRPGPGDLLFVVKAGQGHRADFLLPAPEVEADNSQAGSGQTGSGQAGSGQSGSGQSGSGQAGEASRLEPAGPSWRDVLGGLGWIAGLTGFAAWYAARRRRR